MIYEAKREECFQKYYSPSHMIQFFKYICKTQVHCAMVITLGKKQHTYIYLINS